MGNKEMGRLAAHIEEYLSKAKIKPSAFAREARVPVPTLTRLLNGQRGMGADNIRRLAIAAGESTDYWLMLAGIRDDDSGVTATSLPKSQTISDSHLASEDLELSDKIARLTPDHRAIVENMVDAMLVQNNLKAATKSRR